MKTVGLLIRAAVVSLAFIFCLVSFAQEQSTSGQTAAQAAQAASIQHKVFLFVQRTDRHVKYSKPGMFHDVLSDISDYLKSKNVAVAVDEFGGRDHAESATPMDTVFTIAADSKASSVMYVAVDRPLTKWIKITVQCFDMSRKSLWQEEVSSGGGMSGVHGFEVATTKLHALLDKHVGQDGMPILATAKGPSEGKQ